MLGWAILDVARQSCTISANLSTVSLIPYPSEKVNVSLFIAFHSLWSLHT